MIPDSHGVHDLVRDEDHSQSTSLGLVDDAQDVSGLLYAECCRRLVEDQHSCAKVNGTSNRKGLSLATGQPADQAVTIGDARDAHLLHFLDRNPVRSPAIEVLERTPTLCWLGPHEEVPADRHQWVGAAELVNGCNAPLLSISWA